MSGQKLKERVKELANGDRSLSPYQKKSPDAKKSRKKELRNSRSSRKLDRSKVMQHDLESDAMKSILFHNLEIENRLKLSAIVYRDSECRNIKHEMNHLLNTYDNECKVRKEVKDKINVNPEILKKHKMVVE